MLQIFNYTLNNQADETADIHIDGEIVDAPTQELYKAFWGDETSVSFRSFRNQIESLKAKKINVYINSPGGHVGDAMAMHDYLNELESRGVTVNRVGRGIIASAATYLLLGKNSSMTENSMLMIHNVQMFVAGDIVQCENQVKAGRKFNNIIRDFYASRTGKPTETISSWMNKETWFNAKEAEQNGFVNKVLEPVDFKNSIESKKWPYQNKEILNTYNSFTIKNSEMKLTEITQAIENSFKKFFGNNKDIQLSDNAAKDFATEIANLIPTEEKITEIVNKAIEEATKDDVKTLGETFVNKSEMEQLQKDIIKSLGNKSTGEEVKNEKTKLPKNRFAGKTFFNEDK